MIFGKTGMSQPPQSQKELIRRYENGERDFPHLRLFDINLKGTDLHQINIQHSHFKKIDLSFTDLRESNLSKVCIQQGNLRGAHLRRADLQEIKFHNVSIRGANLSEANLQNSELADIDIVEADLSFANLQNSNLYQGNLQGVDLIRANLQNTNLQKANLRFADLSFTDLRGANLRFADLSFADLRGAGLEGVDLGSANLNGTILSETDLLEAEFQGVDLRSIHTGEFISLYQRETESAIYIPYKESLRTQEQILLEKAVEDFMQAIQFTTASASFNTIARNFKKKKFLFNGQGTTQENEIQRMYAQGRQALEKSFLQTYCGLIYTQRSTPVAKIAQQLIRISDTFEELTVRMGAILWIKYYNNQKVQMIVEYVSPALAMKLERDPRFFRNIKQLLKKQRLNNFQR